MKVSFIKSDGSEIAYRSWAYTDSFNQYCSSLKVICAEDDGAGTIGMVINGEVYSMFQIAFNVIGHNMVEYTYWPEAFVGLQNKTFPIFMGMSSYEDLLTGMGIEVKSKVKTLPSYWCLPETRYKKLFDLTLDLVKMQGGGPLCTFLPEGKLLLLDCDSAIANLDKVPFKANNIVAVKYNTGWMQGYPSQFNIVNYTLEGTQKQEVSYEEQLGKGFFRSVLYNEKTSEYSELLLRNNFKRKLWTSVMMQYEDVHSEVLSLGTVMHDETSGKDSILYQVTAVNDGDKAKLSMLTCSKP